MVSGNTLGNEWKARLRDYLSGSFSDVHLVGVGNTLRGDDAVGPRIIEKLLRDYGRSLPVWVRVHDNSHSPERELSKIDLSSSRLVIFDAVESSNEPGSIICTTLSDTKYGFFATHNIPLRLIPSLSTDPASVLMVGIQPSGMEVGDDLSTTVGASVDEVVRATASLLGLV